MVHYNKPHLTVRWDDQTEAVHMDWHDFADGEPYREGLDAGLDLVEERDATRWLADLRDLGVVSEEDKQWSNEEWFPRALESSLSSMAIVRPESVIADMAVDDIMQEVGDGEITVKNFEDIDAARKWLDDRLAPA